MPARKAENKGLPARWSIRRDKFYYEPPRGQEHHWDGKRLFPLGASYQEALRTFADRMQPEPPKGGKTIGDAIDRYLLEVSPKKAARSFANDVRNVEPLKRVFGAVKLKTQFDVSWAHQYIDTPRDRRNAGGEVVATARAPTQARQEIALLSAILTQCVEWGWVRRNELIGQFRRRRPPPRTRDVTTGDLDGFKVWAPPWLRAYVDLKALMGIRETDMLALRETDASDTGILVEPSKTINSTGKRLLFVWTPDLRAAWTAALLARPRLHGLADTRTDHIFQVRKGGPYSVDSFQSTWQRVMAKAVAAGVERFQERDIRAHTASESMSVEEAQQRLGHASPAITRRVYRRRPEKVAPLR